MEHSEFSRKVAALREQLSSLHERMATATQLDPTLPATFAEANALLDDLQQNGRSPVYSGQFPELFEAAPMAILAIGQDNCIRIVNEKAVEMFGYGRDDLLGQPLDILLPQRFRKAHTHHIADFFDHPNPRPMGIGMELVAQHKNGMEFPVEVGLNALNTAVGMMTVSFIIDISERKRAEELVQQERKRISMALHDGVVQSLYAIGMQLSLLIEPDTPDADQLRQITGEVDTVIEDIRRYILNLKAQDSQRKTMYEYLIEDILTRLHVPEHIALDIDVPSLPPPFPSPTLDTLYQMITEAISNAVRHSHAQHLKIQTRQVGGAFKIVIADDGQGFNLETANHRDGHGLENLRQHALRIGGKLDIDSAPEQGTTITISVPV